MFKSWRLGRVFGFPVEINLSFLLLLALVFVAFGGLAGVFVTCIAFASVLLHELGHAVVARRLGVHVAGIELSFFGGAAKMADMPRRSDHEIAIAAAGPAVSLMLGGLGLGLGAALHVPLLGTIGWINFVLAAFNLIPALPMDGGRILRALLSKKVGFVRATDLSVQVSRVVAVAFGVIGLFGAYQLLVLAPFLWMMASREQLIARMSRFEEDRGVRGFAGFGTPYRSPGEPSRRDAYTSGRMHRFTVRQVGGRLVIEAIE